MAAYHFELIDQAIALASGGNPTQADLRRSISASYYAVFHLLTTEAAAYWSHRDSRAAFARIFEHSALRRSANRLLDAKTPPPSALRTVAKAFLLLQDERYLADYHNGRTWTVTEALESATTARHAFQAWQSVREEPAALDYLISFLIRSRD